MLKIRNKIIVTIIIVLIILPGCNPQHERIIDQLAIFIGLGVDIDRNDPDIYVITTSNPTFSPEAEAPVVESTVKGYGLDGALKNWEYQRQNRYALGKVATVIFGEELTKHGLVNILLELHQVADMNVLAQAVYFPGEPHDAWAIKPPEEARREVFLLNMLERLDEQGLVPRVSISELNSLILNEGIDAYFPQIELTEDNNRFHATGLALLDADGKMATVLNETEMLQFLIMENNAVSAFLTARVSIDGSEGNLSYVIKSHGKTKINTKINNGKPEFDIRVPLEVEVVSARIDGNEYLTREFFQEAQGEISRDLTVQLQKLINKFQHYEVDPLGLGQRVRINELDYYKKGKWRNDYPEAVITCKVEARVSRVNVIKEKP